MGKKRRVARLAEEAARKGRAEWEEDGMIFLQVEAFGEPRTFLWPVTLDQSWRIFPARKDWRWGRRSLQNSGWTVN